MLQTFLKRCTFGGAFMNARNKIFFYVLQIPENAAPFVFGIMPLGKY